MHQLIKEEALRAALQRFYAAQSDSLPLTILRLMRFAFGWSSFAYTTITLPGLGLNDLAVNALELGEVGGGLAELAVMFGNDGGVDADLFARSCAAPMSRPMVRDEAFRSMFTWLQRTESSASSFAAAHYDALPLTQSADRIIIISELQGCCAAVMIFSHHHGCES